MDKDDELTFSDEQDDVADMVRAADLNEKDDSAELIMAANLNEADDSEEDDADDLPEEEDPLPDEELLPDEEAEEEDTEADHKRRPGLFRPLLFVIIVCFCIIAAADMISQQNEIAQLEQETVMMTGKIEETKQLNDEYSALLEADEDDFMERVAVEQLGYSYPNERRYYIVNKSDER